MKKIAAMLVGAILFSTAFGCAKTPTEGGDLPTLVIGGALHEPFFYEDRNGNFAGIDVEIATIACERMGFCAEFKNIEWVKKDSLLSEGVIDCAWTCFSMNDREDEYLWAGPYAQDREVVAVLAESEIKTLADLEGKTIAVQMTSQAEKMFLSSEYYALPRLKSVFSLYDLSESVSAMRRKYVDACVGHKSVLVNKLISSAVEYRLLDETLLYTNLGVAFDKSRTDDTCALLDRTLDDMKKDGTIRAIFQKHGVDEVTI